MADNSDLIKLVKMPILIALAVTVARALAEFAGLPNVVVMVLGVAWLHILFPIYFAKRVLEMGFASPFVAMLKATVIWAVPVRAVIALTYVTGYVFQVQSTRFQPGSLGPLGEETTPLQGFVMFPAINFASWMVGAVFLASITGGLTILLLRKRAVA